MILVGVYGLAPVDMVLKLPADHAAAGDDDGNVAKSDLEAPEASSLVILSNIAHSMHSLPTFSMESPRNKSPRHVAVYPEVVPPPKGHHHDDDDETEWEINAKVT
jgi:hypothetical protein